MKVSKEDVIGVLTALEIWFEQRDPAAELRRWNDDLATIAVRLNLPDVRTEIIEPHGVVRVPRLRIAWDLKTFALTSETLRLHLLDNEPRVMLDDTATTENSIQIDPFGLQLGEADQVGRAVVAALSAPAAEMREPQAPTTDVSGDWTIDVSFLQGTRSHHIVLRQQDDVVAGSQCSHQFEGPVTGTIHGGRVDLEFSAWHEGAMIAFRLEGAVTDGQMRGQVTLGTATVQRRGPINLAQFGTGSFRGIRTSPP
jgi:hypothetical protein